MDDDIRLLGLGVARVHEGSVSEIAKARSYDRGDDFLLQEMIEPKWGKCYE